MEAREKKLDGNKVNFIWKSMWVVYDNNYLKCFLLNLLFKNSLYYK